MNTENINIQIEAKVDQATKSIEQLNKSIGGLSTQIKTIQGGMTSLEKTSQKTGLSMKNAFKFLTAEGLFHTGIGLMKDLAKHTFEVNTEFENMSVLLKTSLGEAAAKGAFKDITEFSKKTPFQVREIMDSFIQLQARGIIPTQKEYANLADLAVSKGKDLDYLTQAALNAGIGRTMMIRSLGVDAKVQGDKLKMTFKGQTTEIDKSQKAVVKYLEGLGQMKGIAGAAEAQTHTLSGSISNLKDKFDLFIYGLSGEGNQVLANFINFLGDCLEKTQPIIDLFADFGSQVMDLFGDIGDLLKSIGVFNDKASAATNIMDLITGVFRRALVPVKLFMLAIKNVTDWIKYLVNEGKKLMNFFGGNFEIDKTINTDFIKKNAEEAIEIMKGFFGETDKEKAEHAKKQAEKDKEDKEAQEALEKKRQEEAKKKQEEDAKKKAAKVKKEKIDELQGILAADEELINEQEKGTDAYYVALFKKLDDEKNYYIKHYKELGMTKNQMYKKVAEIDSKIKKEDANQIKDEEKQRKKEQKEANEDLKAQDELAIITAKNDKELYDNKRKQLEDNLNIELQKEELTDNEKLLLKEKYKGDLTKINEEETTNSFKNKEDILKKEKETADAIVGFGIDKFNKLKSIEDQEYALKQQTLKAKYDLEIAEAERLGKDTSDITAKYNADTEANTAQHTKNIDDLSQKSAEFRSSMYKSIGDASGALTALMEDHTDIQKTVAIAQATMDTYAAANKALNDKYAPGIPGLVMKIAAVTTTIATGIANVKKITSVGTKSGGGGSSTSTPSVTQFAAPQMMGLGGNRIGNPKDYMAQRTYVLESDISASQYRLKTIQNSAILGH